LGTYNYAVETLDQWPAATRKRIHEIVDARVDAHVEPVRDLPRRRMTAIIDDANANEMAVNYYFGKTSWVGDSSLV
jgi:uncharacterized Ntn-hydrolase superfamily protein